MTGTYCGGRSKAEKLRTKESEEQNREGQMLYSPKDMNKAILRDRLYKWGWRAHKLKRNILEPFTNVEYSRTFEMDAIKNKVGVEIQFGKYAFVPFDLFLKMVTYVDNGIIEVGIEVIPMKSMAKIMSSGVPKYEQHYAEVIIRGEKETDAPFLLLGIGPTPLESSKQLHLPI